VKFEVFVINLCKKGYNFILRIHANKLLIGLENSRDWSFKTDRDQDQDHKCQDEDTDCKIPVSRPRPWSWELHLRT